MTVKTGVGSGGERDKELQDVCVRACMFVGRAMETNVDRNVV